MSKKISALPAASSVSSDDVIPVVIGGVTKRATAAQIAALAPGGAGSGDINSGISQVKGIKGVTLETGDTLGTGDVWIKRAGSTLRAGRPVAPGHTNPCDLGATPAASEVWDSVQDDTAFLQAALDTAPRGGVIQIPPGNYFISAPLRTQARSTHIQGTGTLSYSNQSVVIHATAAMPYMLLVEGATTVEYLFLDCARLADYGVARNGDATGTYRNVTVYAARFDGFHSLRIKLPYPLVDPFSPVVTTGTSPDITVEGYPRPLYSGDFQIHILSTADRGDVVPPTFEVVLPASTGGGTIGPFNIPDAGRFCIARSTTEFSIGILVTFPAGTYTTGDLYDWTVTEGAGQVNDQTRFTDCWATGCGTVYATAGFLGGVRPLTEMTFRSLNYASVAGTVSITAGSQTVVGSGTSFIDANARSADYIRIGAYPDWAPGTHYFVGDKVVASGVTPGQCFVWVCTTEGDSDASDPEWLADVAPGNMPTSLGGVVVADGTAVWQCFNPLVFQILNIQDDGTIVLCMNATPINNATGLDYALCVGSGYYSESSADANTTTIEGGVYNNNAACGICSTSSYSDCLLRGQASDNGVCGISFGVQNDLSIDHLVIGSYSEGNLCAHVILACVDGIDIIHPVFSSTPMPVYQMRPSSWGAWRGNSTVGGIVDQPLGSAAYSTVPVVSTGLAKLFQVQGPIAFSEISTASIGSSAFQFTPDQALIRAACYSPITLVSNPTILPGLSFGQTLRIFNYGGNPFTLDASCGMTLEADFVTIEVTNDIEFWWDGYTWRQKGAVGRGTNRAHPIVVVNGANNDVPNPGDVIVTINDVMVTGAFSITGIVAGRDKQELTILNLSTQTMTLKDNDGGSSAANQIATFDGNDIVLASIGYSSAKLIYSAAAAKWLVVHTM